MKVDAEVRQGHKEEKEVKMQQKKHQTVFKDN